MAVARRRKSLTGDLSPNSAEHSVAAIALRYLYQHGVRHVFGIVGREAVATLLTESEIQFVLTRHEFAAGIMADVLARLTGIPQVCFCTLGPGVTNMATGIASACLDRSPVIVLAAQAESFDLFYNQTHQSLDSVSIVKSMTKFAAALQRPDEIVSLLEQAYEHCMTEQLGPSFLSLPIDLLRSPAKVDQVFELFPLMPVVATTVLGARETSRPDWQEQLGALATRIKQATHPLFVAGGAVCRRGADTFLRQLSEDLGIPIVMSYAAMGLLPRAHPLNFGAITSYMDGILDFDALDAIFGPADLIVTFGYDYAEDLRPTMWTRGQHKSVVHVASTPNEVPQVLHPELSVVHPLQESVGYLYKILAGSPKKTLYDITSLRQRIHAVAQDSIEHPEGLTPQQIISAINEVLGNGILVSDVGLYRHFAVLFANIDRPGTFITSDGLSTFGFGLPAAMAAKLAKPDQTVIALCGDGGFQASSPDLETAVRYDLPIVVIVLRNQSNGLISLYQKVGHGKINPATVEFGPVNYTALAAANGWHGLRVDTLHQLPGALGEAVNMGKPVLIEVPVYYPDLAISKFRVAGIS